MKHRYLLALSLIGATLLSSCGSEMIIEYKNYTIKAPATMKKINKGQYANNDYVLLITWASTLFTSSYPFTTDYMKDLLISSNVISYTETTTIHIGSDGMVDNNNGIAFPYASYKNKGSDNVTNDYFCVATRDETGIYLFTYGAKPESS